MDVYSVGEMADACGIDRARFVAWLDRSRLDLPRLGKGNRRLFGLSEAARVAIMVELNRLGATPKAAADMLARIDPLLSQAADAAMAGADQVLVAQATEDGFAAASIVDRRDLTLATSPVIASYDGPPHGHTIVSLSRLIRYTVKKLRDNRAAAVNAA